MKHWFWIVVLLSAAPLFGKDTKLGGYVFDAAAFRNIQTYCLDTTNLSPWDEKTVQYYVAHESQPKGLLTKLPWRKLESCADGADARLRLEFQPHHFLAQRMRNDVNGVLLVFKPSSPSPIYETREVVMQGDDNNYVDATSSLLSRRHHAVDFSVRALVHDWLKLSGPDLPDGAANRQPAGVRSEHADAVVSAARHGPDP